MILIDKRITKAELQQIAVKSFGNLVKAVVDINRKVMVIDAGLHADEEALLLSQGSKQADLWGINLYPELEGEEFIEFDSMINLRPGGGNMSRGVDNPAIQKKIRIVIHNLVK
jgi:hypothetical protein